MKTNLSTSGAGKAPYCPNSIIGRFRKARFLAVFTGFSMLYQLVFPVISFGLTSGPASPDFSSFEPVATTNMVNEFTGQFTYNLPVLEIPGANGAGYPLSLSYHSGDGPESEASWVGYGWSLNPGCINRSKRGLPDDFKGSNPLTTINYTNNVPKNWTIAGSAQLSAQLFSNVAPAGSLSATIRYNNYKGFGFGLGAGVSVFDGSFSLQCNVADGEATFSPAINPAAILSHINNVAKSNYRDAGVTATKQSSKLSVAGIGMAMGQEASKAIKGGLGNASTRYINYLLTESSSPYNITPFSGYSISGYLGLSGDLPFPSGEELSATISYSSQQNEPASTIPAYGYLYSGNAYNNDSNNQKCVMDYTVEHASTFNSRDKYLPVPFSTPDAFLVSGEGISGGFRLYNDRVGVFSPNYAESHTRSDAFGVDAHVGGEVGAGAEADVNGGSSIKIRSAWSDWKNGTTDSSYFIPYDFRDTLHTISEASFFRFNNDLGGKLVYDNSDKAVAAQISGKEPNIPNKYFQVQQGAILNKTGTGARRNSRASYIGYHTNKEIKVKNGSYRLLAYEKDEKVNLQAGRSPYGLAPDDGIGEISCVNESGNRYVYGLPVYNSNEGNYQVGLSIASGDNYLVNADPANSNIQVSEATAYPYAGAYLLTQITTPDYVDINQNGPDDGDFGGYTKFVYKRGIGDDNNKYYSSNLYHWRAPYQGLYYKPNRFSSKMDNMGAYQTGSKEQYYLDTIVTKTHFAVFITDDNRADGIDAALDRDAALGSSIGTKKQKMLSMIQLYSKPAAGQPAKLIKTVHFAYSYDCWPGIPNTTSTGSGKLTLKKVWFEYNGVINAKISPYQFDYNYPQVNYPSQYQYIKDEMLAKIPAAGYPRYTPYIDCWGNYMYDGQNRRNAYQSWDSQIPDNSFDPAAWQLKRIVLPSGGEIHVQYEQNTYSYVQDRPACAMVKLVSNNDGQHSDFDIDLSDLGITTTNDRDRLIDLINNTYKNKKIYFKFFYTLIGNYQVPLNDCNGDYLEGHANFVSASANGSNIKINVTSGGSNAKIPRDVCIDYIHHEVGGKSLSGNCDPSNSDPGGGQDALLDLMKGLANGMINSLDAKGFSCMTLNPQYSYLRIPVLKKKGGGIRVKRLLMYNKGIDANTPTLYGTQYVYDNDANGTSYGVATNEPWDNKEENPLVTYMEKRNSQNWVDKTISGTDKEQFEGPLGLNALPAASIGYSRIIKVNIAQAKDIGTGYTVVDYYTAKDYPFDRYYAASGTSGVSNTDIQVVKDDWNIDIGFLQYNITTGMRASQGYSFIQNQMHGQLKSIATFPNFFNAGRFNNPSTPPTPVSQQTYTYFEPGEAIPMYDFTNWQIVYDNPGKEMDITIDRRSVEEESHVTRITGDLTVSLLFGIPFPIAFPVTSGEDAKMNTIVVNKVVHYPAIVKSVTSTKDGVKQRTDNIAFDPLTAQPVITATYDGYAGLYLQDRPNVKHKGTYWHYNVPASSQYIQMGQKAWNERYCFYSKNTTSTDCISVSTPSTAGVYTVYGINVNNMFKPGDQIALYQKSSFGGGVDMAHVMSTSGSDVNVLPSISLGTGALASNTYKYYKAEIVHSSFSNQLTSSTGGFTTYDSTYEVVAHGDNQSQNVYYDTTYYPVITKANVTTYMDSSGLWAPMGLSMGIYGVPANYSNYNVYEAGKKGVWRPSISYVYRDNIKAGANNQYNQRVYLAGTTIFHLSNVIPWCLMPTASGTLNTGTWIKTSQSNLYTPDGNPAMDADVDNVYSTAKYGYYGALPYLVAQNAQYNSVRFEGFENLYGSYVEDSVSIVGSRRTSDYAHTGKYSYHISGDFININKTIDYLGKGLIVRFWARAQNNQAKNFRVIAGGSTTLTTTFVARSGDWALYEARWANATPNAGTTISIGAAANFNPYIDDIRIQQTESKTSAYVYDVNTFKLAATLDDQNFATYYQYNGEGKLVRKRVETQRGIKTAEEAQYHTPLLAPGN